MGFGVCTVALAAKEAVEVLGVNLITLGGGEQSDDHQCQQRDALHSRQQSRESVLHNRIRKYHYLYLLIYIITTHESIDLLQRGLD